MDMDEEFFSKGSFVYNGWIITCLYWTKKYVKSIRTTTITEWIIHLFYWMENGVLKSFRTTTTSEWQAFLSPPNCLPSFFCTTKNEGQAFVPHHNRLQRRYFYLITFICRA